jgi:hypothetical protein
MIATMLLNWQAGWWLMLSAFVTGAGLGLFFHRENFLGGYGSFRRRMLRLGHIALAALGMLNLIVALGPDASRLASWCFVAGGVTMPLVCFLTAWRPACRHLFLIPVVALFVAAGLMAAGRADVSGDRPVEDEAVRPAAARYEEDGR